MKVAHSISPNACPVAVHPVSVTELNPGIIPSWSIASDDCDVTLWGLTGAPLASPTERSVGIAAFPRDLRKGGTATVTARAAVGSTVETASATVSFHPIPYEYEITFQQSAQIFAAAGGGTLRLGGRIGVDQKYWFATEGTVTLTRPCQKPDCGARRLRLGWAQSVDRSTRIESYPHARVVRRLPGLDHARGDVIIPPMRDGADPNHFFADDAYSKEFLAGAAKSRLRDYPGATAPLNRGNQIGDLVSLKLDQEFIAWLVVRQDWWWANVDARQSARCVANLRWDVVAKADRQGASFDPNTQFGYIQWKQPKDGQGDVEPRFDGPVANDAQTAHLQVLDNSGNVIQEAQI